MPNKREHVAAVAAQEEAEAVAAAPIFVPPPVVAAPVKAAGVSTPGKYVADLADARAFVAHVLATPDLAHMIQAMALSANSEVQERARRQGEMFKLPGWTGRFQRSLSVRG